MAKITQARCRSWRVAVAAISRITSYSCLTCLQCCLSARITVLRCVALPTTRAAMGYYERSKTVITESWQHSACLELRPIHAAPNSLLDSHHCS